MEQILVQSCHAALEAGSHFPNPTREPCSVIVLSVKDQIELEEAFINLSKSGIKLIKFYEPDEDRGLTSFASEPVFQDQRKTFRQYKLFRWGV